MRVTSASAAVLVFVCSGDSRELLRLIFAGRKQFGGYEEPLCMARNAPSWLRQAHGRFFVSFRFCYAET